MGVRQRESLLGILFAQYSICGVNILEDPGCFNQIRSLYSRTYVVNPSETQIIKHVVRNGVGYIASINVQSSKHDTDPNLNS